MIQRGRGIALVTALFAVVLLLGFVTALLAQLHGDLALTRDLDQRARARALARSAVQAGLCELNRDPAWEALHTGSEQAAVRPLGPYELRFWVEATGNPDVIRLQGAAQGSQHTMLVSRRGGPGGLLVQANNQALFQSNSDGSWTLLPEAPEKVEHPVGGPAGEVYAGAKGRVYHLDPLTGSWSLLTPLPSQEKPRSLAVDGHGKLYCLTQDAVLTLRDGLWQALPALSGKLEHLSADQAGHVWVIQDRRTPWRYDPQLQRWQSVAEPPSQAWTRLDSNPRRPVLRPVDDPRIKSAAVDPAGNLFLSGPKRQGVVTLYRFVPENGQADRLSGSYRILPVVPKVKMKKSEGELLAHETDEFVKKADNLALDASGTLYFRMPRDGFDTLYQAQVQGTPEYATLSGIPKVKQKNGVRVEVPGKFSDDVKYLGAGRNPASGSPRYVPRYSE